MQGHANIDPTIAKTYQSGRYWSERSDLMYYSYLDYIVRTIGRDARTMLDVGTANCPYLEWFDWIPDRYSFDLVTPYTSEAVQGIQGDLHTHHFAQAPFDVVTCLQVLEHVPDAARFAQDLLRISKVLIVSVPHRWGAKAAADHIHDPISYEKLTGWMGREANYHQVIKEPFRAQVGERLIAVYDSTRDTGYGRRDFKDRVRRHRFPT